MEAYSYILIWPKINLLTHEQSALKNARKQQIRILRRDLLKPVQERLEKFLREGQRDYKK